MKPSEITLGEAFVIGDIDVDGDIFSVFSATEHIFRCPQGRRRKLVETVSRLFLGAVEWWNKGMSHSVQRDKAAISHHYDQPVGFYQPWLGDSLVYSCAYFRSPDDDLVAAQENKLEHICRKLRLHQNDRFLDVGCGWGSLILHAAARHHVYSQGITISQEQASVAARRIEAVQLTQSCRVDLLDYREALSLFSRFDKISSLGMFEHVGMRNLPRYFSTVYSMLKPGGVFLNHGIARASNTHEGEGTIFARYVESLATRIPRLRRAHSSSFISKYVFPDGELVTVSEALRMAESAGFEVRDVENLREHYELTLRAWADGLQRTRSELLKLVSEAIYRTWLLYIVGSAEAFRRGDIAIYQMLLSRLDGGSSRLPLTREDWYRQHQQGSMP